MKGVKHPGVPRAVERLRQLDKPDRIAALNELLAANPDQFVDPAGFQIALDFNAHLITALFEARVCIW